MLGLLAWLLLPAQASGDEIREITYGGDENFPPYEFINDKGEPAGLNIDLMRAIARARGVRVHFKLMPWRQVRAALDRDEIQVAAMYRSLQRATEVSFAIPHELVHHEMYIRSDAPPLRTLDDLEGKRILVQEGTYSVDALTALGHGERLIRKASEPEALRALISGEGDVAVVTQAVGRPFERKQFTDQGITATGAPVLLNEYAFVTRLGRPDLIEFLNDGVVAAKRSGEYDAIYDRWVGPGREGGRWMRRIAWGLGIMLALVAWFVLWNRALSRRVAHQTLALRREFEERERAQNALAENEKKLRRAQRMETVGRLAGGVAHDFNNVLTVILNYANFLRLDLGEAGRPTDEVDEIIAAAERAERLTRQLLSFSRDMPVEVRRLDLCAVVRDMAGMIRRLVGEDVAVEIKLSPEAMVAEIDRTGIEQALLNLAANARDAMAFHGLLTITVDGRTLTADNPHPLPGGDYVSIRVADTGTGMTAETLAHLAEPFFTTKEVGKGTGLGLASVFATVTKMNGKVSVQTEIGRGSTFELFLPRLDAAAAPDLGPAVSNCPAVEGKNRTVLLVEDDESLRRAAQIALVRHGFQVVEARDGEHALELESQGCMFHVVVTDVVMPRMNGPELAKALRRRQPDARILFVSGYVRKDAGLDLSPEGTGFLSKPYRADQLVMAVADLLAGRGQRLHATSRLIE